MFAIFSGIFQFAYSFYVYNTLVVAVREGARYASIKPYDSTTTQRPASRTPCGTWSFTATRIHRVARDLLCPTC